MAVQERPEFSFPVRVGFGATLAVAMGVGPFLNYALSTLAPLIVEELDLTRTEFGSLAFVAFGVAAASAWFVGRLVDRLGPLRILSAMFATAGAACLIAGLATSLAWLWCAVAVSGLAQAVSNPVTNRLISSHISGGRRGVLLGVKQSGVQMIQAVVGLSLPGLAILAGWRASIMLGAILMPFGFFAGKFLVPQAPEAPLRRSASSHTPVTTLTLRLALYMLITGIAVQATIAYLPLYAYERVGFSSSLAGFAAGAAGVIGMISRIVWGRVAELLDLGRGALIFLAGGSALSSLAFMLASRLGGVLLWIGIVVFSSTSLAISVVVMFVLISNSGPRNTGQASGIVVVGLYLGFMVGPIAFGYIVDVFDSYDYAWLLLGASSVLGAAAVTNMGRRNGAGV